MANTDLIKQYLEEFSGEADEWFKEATFLEERYSYFKKFFDKKALERCEWEDIQKLGDNLHCFATNALAKKRAFGNMNHPLEHYKESLLYLAHGKDAPKDRIDNVSDKKGKYRLKYISGSAISELIGYIMPEKYTFFNSRSKKALALLGISLPKKRKETLGDKFENFSLAIKPISELYEKVVGRKTSLPLNFEIDQFFSYLYEAYEDEIEGAEDSEEASTVNESGDIKMSSEIKKQNEPLNQILFGPPGTGKTFKIIEKSLSVVLTEEEKEQIDWNNRHDVVAKFNEFRQKGYIEMVTFHQSYSYEEFVEGIRPEVSSENESDFILKDGVFKEFVVNADPENDVLSESFKEDLSNVKIYKISLGNTQVKEDNSVYEYCIKNGRIAIGYGQGLDFSKCDTRDKVKAKLQETNPDIKNNDYDITSVNYLKNVLKEGDLVIVSDGNRKFRAIGVLKSDKYIYEEDESFSQQREVTWLNVFQNSLPVQTILTCNFSQMSIYEFYTDKLKMDALAELVYKKKSKEKRNYVFIIDEINRGNLSKIFGELITLLEEDKRKGNLNGVPVKLPYSTDEFIIPSNLYVMGTMNTADRSIAMMDMALRRRFEFQEVSPKGDHVPDDVEGIRLREIFNLINEKISILLSRDFKIGHSYFMHGKASSIDALKQTWFGSVLPLINEYFYDESMKIEALVKPFIVEGEKVLIEGFEYLSDEQSVEFKDIEKVNNDDFKKYMNGLLSNEK